jgi:hypothetical protein
MDDRQTAVLFSAGLAVSTAPERPDLLWGPHNLVFNGKFFFGVRRLGREGDRSPSSSIVVYNE